VRVADDAAPSAFPTGATHVQSVDRAIALLEALASSPGGEAHVVALARTCGLNRTTAWRILRTLESRQIVSRAAAAGEFRLGDGLRRLQPRATSSDLLDRGQAVLERLSLETGETACLGIVDGDRVLYAAEVIPAVAGQASWLGECVHLHASAMGKAFLSAVLPEQVEGILRQPLPRYTAATITELRDLHVDLDRARAVGYAICRGELDDDSWGVASPILDASGRPVGVLCLWGPEARGDVARFNALGRLSRRAAAELSESRSA
jgi:IclR family acetate operon transcriptional repressor